MSMWIKIVTARDLFEGGALLIYEGKEAFFEEKTYFRKTLTNSIVRC